MGLEKFESQEVLALPNFVNVFMLWPQRVTERHLMTRILLMEECSFEEFLLFSDSNAAIQGTNPSRYLDLQYNSALTQRQHPTSTFNISPYYTSRQRSRPLDSLAPGREIQTCNKLFMQREEEYFRPHSTLSTPSKTFARTSEHLASRHFGRHATNYSTFTLIHINYPSVLPPSERRRTTHVKIPDPAIDPSTLTQSQHQFIQELTNSSVSLSFWALL
ncbi:hypothetical protein BDZ45DRAFT_810607 [Acephala macrosclerotiorum]|nr:hypothetical protein BDZ45DRAFT_810607 [Acephala macrosclerotiorum]